jgi:hypothetical protein
MEDSVSLKEILAKFVERRVGLVERHFHLMYGHSFFIYCLVDLVERHFRFIYGHSFFMYCLVGLVESHFHLALSHSGVGKERVLSVIWPFRLAVGHLFCVALHVSFVMMKDLFYFNGFHLS